MTTLLRPQPPLADPGTWSFPTFTRGRLSNGMQTIVCHLADRPVVDVRVLLGASPRREQAHEYGVAVLAQRALSESTAVRSPEEFALDVESLGANIDVNLDWDALVPRLTAPVDRLRDALVLFAEALTQPGFGEAEVERLVRTQRSDIESGRQYPKARAGEAFARAAFDPSSRLAFPARGTLDTVQRLDTAVLRSFWERNANPSDAVAIVVGDLRGIDVEALLDASLGAWIAPGADAAPLDPERPVETGATVVVDFPGAVQTEFVVGAVAAATPVDMRAALRVAAHYLGGFMSSRLMAKLREEKSITYGVSAGVGHTGGVSSLQIETAVQTDASVEATVDILDELDRLADGEIDEALVRDTIDNLVRTAPIGFKSTNAIAGSLVRMQLEGLPDDYFDRVHDDIRRTTPAEMRAAFCSIVRPGSVAVAAAGEAGRMAEGLGALRGGSVEIEPFA